MEPPRGRGKVACADQTIQPDGITPAWAGKSLFCFAAAVPIQDHPRVGGEKVVESTLNVYCWGSPPRGRGKADGAAGRAALGRITPAQAGKSSARFPHRTSARDHPRIGGEKGLGSQVTQLSQGSPPRGRGKVIHHRCAGRCGRITPARAGKSLASQPWSPPLWMMVIRPRP